MDASVANWWNEEEYAVDINEEDYLISIESVDHSITTRAKYEKRCASSDINNNDLRAAAEKPPAAPQQKSAIA